MNTSWTTEWIPRNRWVQMDSDWIEFPRTIISNGFGLDSQEPFISSEFGLDWIPKNHSLQVDSVWIGFTWSGFTISWKWYLFIPWEKKRYWKELIFCQTFQIEKVKWFWFVCNCFSSLQWRWWYWAGKQWLPKCSVPGKWSWHQTTLPAVSDHTAHWITTLHTVSDQTAHCSHTGMHCFF